MIDYLSEVKPLEHLSDQQIAEHLNAKTANAMQPEPSAYILSDSGAVLSSPSDGSRFGSLIDHYEVADDDAKNLIAFFIERILDNKQEVSTNEYPRSVQFQSVCASFPAALQGVCDQLVEAAGGRPHSGVTEADVAQSRTDWEAQEAERIEHEQEEQQIEAEMQALTDRYTKLFNENIAPLENDKNTSNDAWQAAIDNMASEWGA